ncbi:hypothetical protein TWF106_009599 [Orbilia oligospora]|uniref:ceramidase n=1 Tax=Orbilia oligospora TaxID=2813651 RepID=A0A7C8UH15_ORBOL|nr:hypothetical protein TWF106_009599 [Orbilia oligospora]
MDTIMEIPPESSFEVLNSQPSEKDPKPDLVGGPRPPVYIVNLDLPPRQRYQEIGKDFKDQFLELTPLFDSILATLPYNKLISFIARVILRRVHNSEEQDEIKGLVDVTDIPLFLMIAFNTFLDTFMGCTSGAVRLAENPHATEPSSEDRDKMVHFRTLDWGMDELRDFIIQIDYQKEGKTIAHAITYAGFVGVLTGVRKDLSVSLNFRPTADEDTPRAKVAYHKLLVLLGFRPSVSSQLRSFLLPRGKKHPPTFEEILQEFAKTPCTPAYVTLCNGSQAVFIEKDIRRAKMNISEEFISGTNHDTHTEAWKPEDYKGFALRTDAAAVGMALELLEDSQHRKTCITRLYEHTSRPVPKTFRRRGRRKAEGGIGMSNVVTWCQTWPITNECTHFSCVMDPKEGEISWVKYHPEPPESGD